MRQYTHRAALPLDISNHSCRLYVHRARVLPDRTVPAVRISSRHAAHLRATRRVLIHVHDKMLQREDGRFVHIPDGDFKGGGVFERTKIGVTRIHMCVHPLDVEGVGLLSLVVERLLGKEP